MKMYEVKALDTYERYRLQDKDLGFIPKEGHIWTVSAERLEVLEGKNSIGKPFIEVIREIPTEEPKTTEKVIPEIKEEKEVVITKRTKKNTKK